MNAFLMLCDFAETINGKLYIQGGGWTRMVNAGEPITMYVAGKIFVPWNQANRQSALHLSLVSDDGQEVLDPSGSAVRMEGNFEVGRPPGTPPGVDLDLPISFRVEGLPMPAGRYRWELRIDGVESTTVPFTIVSPAAQ
jgi:hypothetical protein